MKSLFFSILFVFLNIGLANAQERFRRDYNYVTFYNSDNNSWSDWQEAEHTIVFNFNENGDIAHYTAKGEILIYRNLGKREENYTNGNHYQIIELLDEEGYQISLQLFDDQKIGMKLIAGEMMIQFSKY